MRGPPEGAVSARFVSDEPPQAAAERSTATAAARDDERKLNEQVMRHTILAARTRTQTRRRALRIVKCGDVTRANSRGGFARVSICSRSAFVELSQILHNDIPCAMQPAFDCPA